MELDKIIKILANESRIFHSFSEEEVLRLLKCCTRKSFKGGDVIFQEDTKGAELYLIITGSVIVKKEGKTLDVIRVGECFGEMGALSGETRSATAEANGDLVLLATGEAMLGELDPGILVKLYKNIILIISERLRERVEEKIR
ncbi:MAG: cyclic nucleotide-binding domain-containing protein [Spirochaetes bacterium]|jgi:serine/threonine-protein kinase|nr:cyclic nucleotide-binding domain-containing protein [Spirochaetota bacterium]